MKIDKELLKRISDVLNHDLESGVYNNFPKLKARLEYVGNKLARFRNIINAEPLTGDEVRLLLDNDVIDEGVYYELIHYAALK